MKQFDVKIDDCKGEALEAGSLFILKKAVFERALDLHPRSKLISPALVAHKEAIEFEKQLLMLDRRLRRGLELIVSKL